MTKFEIGKRYTDGSYTVEITKRTAKTIRFKTILHAGKANEKAREEKTAKINNWNNKEVFFTNCYQIEA